MTDTSNDQIEKTITPPSSEMRLPQEFRTVHHSHVGPILAVLVIMLVLILGGLYLWGGMLSKEAQVREETPIVNNEPETPRAVADQEILEIVSPSDELDAIDADINSTNFDSLEGDLMTIDIELDATFAQ